MKKGLEGKPYKERLDKIGMFSSQKKAIKRGHDRSIKISEGLPQRRGRILLFPLLQTAGCGPVAGS